MTARFAIAIALANAGCALLAGVQDGQPYPNDAAPATNAPSAGHGSGAVSDGYVADGGSRETAPTTFCTSLSPSPTLCADFDEGDVNAMFANGAISSWIASPATGGAQTSLDTTEYFSAPAALAIDVPARSDTTASSAFLHHAMPFTTTASLALDLRIDPAQGTATEVVLGGYQLGDASNPYLLSLYLAPPDANGARTLGVVEEGYGVASKRVHYASTTKIADPTHVRFDASIARYAPTTLKLVLVTGAAAAGAPALAVYVQPLVMSAPTVRIGAAQAAPAGETRVALDDVTLTAH